MVTIHKNMSLREAITVALQLGCTVKLTGEAIIRHPSWRDAKRVKLSRHDASQPLVSKLRQLAKAQRKST